MSANIRRLSRTLKNRVAGDNWRVKDTTSCSFETWRAGSISLSRWMVRSRNTARWGAAGERNSNRLARAKVAGTRKIARRQKGQAPRGRGARSKYQGKI